MLLAVAILASLPAINMLASAATSDNLPVVFIGGKGTVLIDKDGNRIFPRTFDIAPSVKKIVPILTKANITKDYDEFCDALCEEVAKQYKDLPLDCNGNAANGTGTDFKWTKTQLSWSVRHDEPYRIYDYCFYYDWRLDPWETADILAQFIDDVLEVTGAPKVRIIGRCLGGDIVLSYLTKYGGAKVDSCLFYVTTINGVATCGAGFAGDFVIDSDAASRFAADLGMDPVFTLGDDTLLNDIVAASVNMLSKNGGVDFLVKLVKNVYDVVEANVVPRLLLATYATFPAYWSMVGSDYFETAKKRVFTGREEEYAGMISKLDNYHYNVQLKAAETLKKLENEGVDISVVCKYGVQQTPVSKEYNMLSDDTVELYRSSFGATCADLDKTFDDSYMRSASLRGTDKYISPDKQVDCSTCLFPDYTWVIKNCTHTDFSSSIDELMMTILRYPGRMSVTDNADYPQYLLYNKQENSVKPLSSDNCDTTGRWRQSFWQSFVKLIKAIFDYIARAFATKK